MFHGVLTMALVLTTDGTCGFETSMMTRPDVESPTYA
jgi:hypothetical protein